MIKYNIGLIGNTYYDIILRLNTDHVIPGETQEVSEIHHKLGGVFNFLRALENDSNIYINLYTSFGDNRIQESKYEFAKNTRIITNNIEIQKNKSTLESIITVDNTGTKTTFPYLCEQENRVKFYSNKELCLNKLVNADWYHIMYIDKLDLNIADIKKIRTSAKIISADLCSVKPSYKVLSKMEKLLGEIDYLFLSEYEAESFAGYLDHYNRIPNILNTNTIPIKDNHDFDNLIEQKTLYNALMISAASSKAVCILHTPTYSFVVPANKNCRKLLYRAVYHNHQLKNINPIGAGDMCAANFIKLMLNKGKKYNMDKILLETHKLTSHLLKTNWTN